MGCAQSHNLNVWVFFDIVCNGAAMIIKKIHEINDFAVPLLMIPITKFLNFNTHLATLVCSLYYFVA